MSFLRQKSGKPAGEGNGSSCRKVISFDYRLKYKSALVSIVKNKAWELLYRQGLLVRIQESVKYLGGFLVNQQKTIAGKGNQL